jgi:hypothetical protein
MLENQKSFSSRSYKLNDIPILKISSPKLPTIKKIFPEINKTPLSDKNETYNTSNIIQKKNESISFINSPRKLINNNSYRNINTKKRFNIANLKKSSSFESILPKKIEDARSFHQHLMSRNKIACEQALSEEYKKYEDKFRSQKEIMELLQGNTGENKKMKTGIYGPTNNIVSVIRAKMERLKYDNEYRGVDPEIKEMLKDEIMDAQVRLKRKPELLSKKKFKIRPLYLRKLDKYRYLSKMNIIREINQISNTPVIIKDGQAMLKLINDAFDNFKINKEKDNENKE